MESTIKLYYTQSNDQWELLPSKLLVMESLPYYLSLKTSKTIQHFQYVKNELELAINIDIGQEYSQPATTNNFKYVEITNYNERPHYYFVKKATWRSKSCVRFELVMDVLNTFHEGTDYIFKANTRIVREHKDRFTAKTTLYYRFEEGQYREFGDAFQQGDKIQFGSDDYGTRFEGTFISWTYNALREIYTITLILDGYITLSKFNNFINTEVDEEICIIKDGANGVYITAHTPEFVKYY